MRTVARSERRKRRRPPRGRRPDGERVARKARGNTRTALMTGARWSPRDGAGATAAGGAAGAGRNTALTPASPRMRTTQAPWPVHPTPQPSNTAPASGVAVSVTAVPAGNVASQGVRHPTPGGSLRTVPGP